MRVAASAATLAMKPSTTTGDARGGGAEHDAGEAGDLEAADLGERVERRRARRAG